MRSKHPTPDAAERMPLSSKKGPSAAPMRKMRVLHIVNWYASVIDPGATPFVRRHIEALAPHCENTVWHLEVRQAPRWKLVRKSLHADRTCLLEMPLKRWYLIEWISTLLVLWAWFTRRRSRRFDLVNVHIAYPLLARIGLLRRIIGLPIVATEHWTAYHYSFYAASRGLDRIRRIFSQDLPLICVSRALGEDIERFSGRKGLPIHVVDNVVETSVFHHVRNAPWTEGHFFALAGWRLLKRPDTLIDAIALLRAAGYPARLRLGGDGPKMTAMKEAIARHGLQDSIDLLGALSPEQAAVEMRAAHAFLHASDYETYCVVCAEALCCGTPVVASAVGGIREYMTSEFGALVSDNEAPTWAGVLREQWRPLMRMDRTAIAQRMTDRASIAHVGARYAAILAGTRSRTSTRPPVA